MIAIIEVKDGFTDHQSLSQKVLEKIESSESGMASLASKLAEDDKWGGVSHDRCVAALQLIQAYTAEIKALASGLEACLLGLEASVDGFEAESKAVAKWQA